MSIRQSITLSTKEGTYRRYIFCMQTSPSRRRMWIHSPEMFRQTADTASYLIIVDETKATPDKTVRRLVKLDYLIPSMPTTRLILSLYETWNKRIIDIYLRAHKFATEYAKKNLEKKTSLNVKKLLKSVTVIFINLCTNIDQYLYTRIMNT